MRILLTGATGFIGSNLTRRLSANHEIFALVRNPHAELSASRVTMIQADLLMPLDERLLPPRMDVIVHLAQHNQPFPQAGLGLFAVNTARTLELLNYGLKVGAGQFVLASSGDVYGYRLDACSETDSVSPTSFYAITKYSSELMVQAYSEHMIPTVFRLFTPYGPGQTGRLVPGLAGRILSGEPVRLHFGSRPLLTPTYIDDVTGAFQRAIETRAAGTFNIAGDTVVSVRALAESISHLLGKDCAFEETGEDVGSVIGDSTKMKQILNINPSIGLSQGLELTLSVMRR